MSRTIWPVCVLLRVVGECVRNLAVGPRLPVCVNKLKQQIMFKSISLRPGKHEIHYSCLLLPTYRRQVCVCVCLNPIMNLLDDIEHCLHSNPRFEPS